MVKISVDPVIDELLEGGLESDVVTTIYGPSGTGKSCFCMICAKSIVKSGKKAIFIDTEGGFSVDRFKQIDPDYMETLQNIMILKLHTFDEQEEAFKKIKDMVNDEVGIVIIDSIGMLYRFEAGKAEKISEVNKALGYQLSILMQISRMKDIPCLLTNQVYSDFDNPGQVKMVGGDIMKYSSKCLIEIKKLKSMRCAIIKKHRSIADNNEIYFEIVNKGLKKIEN